MSAAHDAVEHWASGRARLRAAVARRMPTVVTVYPFEVFVALLGALIGIPLILGLAAPTSLSMLLPAAAFYAYASALVIGSGTVAVGLRRDHPMVLASGLQLLGGSWVVYAVAVVALAGISSAFAALCAFLCLGLLSVIRASHFRRIIDIQMGARRLGGRQ